MWHRNVTAKAAVGRLHCNRQSASDTIKTTRSQCCVRLCRLWQLLRRLRHTFGICGSALNWISSFLSGRSQQVFSARQHTAARYWYGKSVYRSVCLSVRYVPVLYENGLKYCHSFFSPYGSPIILVLPASSRNSDGVTACGGAKYRWGIKISRFSTNKSLYLANNTIYRHSYYGRRIGKRTQAFEWHHFQWTRVTSKPYCKVTILFNIK